MHTLSRMTGNTTTESEDMEFMNELKIRFMI